MLTPERRELVYENRRLTTFILKRYFSRHRCVPDLYAELKGVAVLALVDAAIRCHSPRRDGDWWVITNPHTSLPVRFSTYACRVIWSKCKRCVENFAKLPKTTPRYRDSDDNQHEPLAPSSCPVDSLLTLDRSRTVRHLLNSLDATDRRIVALKYGIGDSDGRDRSHEEVGQILGISKVRVGQRLNRALSRLRLNGMRQLMQI